MSGNNHNNNLFDSDNGEEDDMDYEPSESIAQESREGTAATESSIDFLGFDDEASAQRGLETIQALLQQVISHHTNGENEGDGEEGESGPGIVELVLDDDVWNDSDEDHQEVFTIVNNTFRVRLPHSRRRRRGTRDMALENLEPVPSEEGRKLMASGDFGYYEFKPMSPKKRRRSSGASVQSPTTPCSPEESCALGDASSLIIPRSPIPRSQSPSERAKQFEESICKRQKILLGKRLLVREMGSYTGEPARMIDSLVAQSLIPTSTEKVLHFENRCYSGQFSEDGDFFYCCSQDMVVRMYDTRNPYDWKYYKKAEYPGGHWTITDASLSPDNRQLAYSSLDSTVYMANTQADEEEENELTVLDFSEGPRQYAMRNGTPIWSIRFSGDGRELIAGAKDDSLYVYDIERQKSILKLTGHENDVNAVCYGDKSSPHILFSGSDDCTIKIWDRRSMASGREAGAFLGHMEGLTYIDSKGDGRYVLSNAKDQTMKLWDIRKMTDRSTYEGTRIRNYSSSHFDYRFETYDYHPIRKHPGDNSIVTFRGHRVLKTLIRCHFSPPNSSGSRYVFSGSEDGRVFIYNLDATIAAVVDVQQGTFDSRPQPAYNWRGFGLSRARPKWDTCTRDVSWHPDAPVIVSTSWNGYGSSSGSVAIHGWDGKIRGEGMTRDDFGYWNKTRRGLRDLNTEEEERSESPTRTDEQLRPLLGNERDSRHTFEYE
ncbi:hypothetical protein TWF106_005265 [Orbilia oligospora]|uniref:Uncharacterized protein n=1 Tax=Orbilia oligospora TaxID=2813651 RepID=A0A6G1MP31_ORBOL|nr:hypothetical protein TWF788_000402 [Orbilia oligospora]KAF3202506.1 hypothetical protein TWF679_010753 [Orbilia oligospora]KAF3222831.1 hypothetical protein TWF106_005265 [Orbilia oligospora]KAF3263593.1 hypothetical protein TWF192_005870 [Orbilia oligospora]